MSDVTCNALGLVASERDRQKTVKGWTPEHDDEHGNQELAYAASAYAGPVWHTSLEQRKGLPPIQWPFEPSAWKPTPDDRIRELVKAGALIVAEIERLMRAQEGGAK